jgi:hypothetical protein
VSIYRYTELDRRRERQDRRDFALVVVLSVVTVVVVFVALVACASPSHGTVTKVTPLPGGTYQLEVIDRPGDSRRNATFELVDAGRSTGCQVGEVWPTCD